MIINHNSDDYPVHPCHGHAESSGSLVSFDAGIGTARFRLTADHSKAVALKRIFVNVCAECAPEALPYLLLKLVPTTKFPAQGLSRRLPPPLRGLTFVSHYRASFFQYLSYCAHQRIWVRQAFSLCGPMVQTSAPMGRSLSVRQLPWADSCHPG